MKKNCKKLKIHFENTKKTFSSAWEKLRINELDRLMMGYFFCFLGSILFLYYTQRLIGLFILIISLVMFILLGNIRQMNLNLYILSIKVAKYIFIFYVLLLIRKIYISNINIFLFEFARSVIDIYVEIFKLILMFYFLGFAIAQILQLNKDEYLKKRAVYYTKQRLFFFYPIIFASGYLIIYMLNKTLTEQFMGIIFGSFIIYIFIASIRYHLMQFQERELKINCVNLDNNEIKKNDVYLLSIKYIDYQIFKLDFDNLFPDDSINPVVYIMNKYYSHHVNKFKKSEININEENNNGAKNDKNRVDVKNSKCIYLSIEKLRTNDKLSIYYSYEQDGEIYNMKCDLYLEIKYIGTTLYVSQYKFKNFRKVRNEFKFGSTSIFNIFTNAKEKYSKNDYPIEYHVLNNIKLYDNSKNKITIDKHIKSQFDPRKWLLHDNQFGTGKTTYDLYFAIQQGYQPVIISPWEDNYDKDILQLIYSKMSKNNRGHFFANIFATISTRAFIFWPIAAAATIVFLDNDIVKGIFDIIYYRILDTLFSSFSIARVVIPLGLHEIRDIFFVVLSIIVSYIGLSSFILFKKDSTRDYQDFFIKRMQSIWKRNPHIFLIVEDIDRLDPDVYNNVFRILSLLNKEFNNNMLGLISLDRKIIENKKGIKLFHKDTKSEMLFKTFENKIIYEEIAKNYDYQASIRQYIDEGIEFLRACGGNRDELKEVYRSTKITNFRDAHKCMEEILKKYYSSKQEK